MLVHVKVELVTVVKEGELYVLGKKDVMFGNPLWITGVNTLKDPIGTHSCVKN